METALDELEKVRELRRFGVDKFAVDFGSSDTTRFVHNRLETFAALSTSSDGAPLIRAICSVVIDGEFPPQKAMEDVVQEIGDLLDVELPQLSSDSPELTSRKAFSFAAMVLQTTPVTGKFTRGGGSIDDTLYLANQLAHQILLKGSHLENRNLFEVKMQANPVLPGIFAD
ncbi:MAG: hypothetical protein U5N86_00475 [Planctomycetota bacterium]|nr:hypothetical protein [Planctomycetota bacterium]